jgi:hypothetical protein
VLRQTEWSKKKIKRPSSSLVNVTRRLHRFFHKSNHAMTIKWVGGRQFTKNETPVFIYTDVRLFHFHDKPKAKFVCSILFLFFKDLKWRSSYTLMVMIMIMNWISITWGHGGSTGKLCRALKCLFVRLKVEEDHSYLYLSMRMRAKWKRKVRWDLNAFTLY